MTVQKWPYLGNLDGVTHWLVAMLDEGRAIQRREIVEGTDAAHDLMRKWGAK